jgi:hypothetical protein
MTGSTLLFRQIHPSFMQEGKPTSQAFRPTQKDNSLLSVYDGDQIAADRAWLHYTTVWKLEAVGTLALTVEECSIEELPARPDPLDDCPQHAVIDFTSCNEKQAEKKSRKLKSRALQRDWQHRAPARD